VLRASLHAAKKRQAAANHAITASIPAVPTTAAVAAGAADNGSSQASSTADTPASIDQQPRAQTEPSSLGTHASSDQQHSQQQQEAAVEGQPKDSSQVQGPAGAPPQQASAATCLQAAQQLLVIANRLQDLVGTLSSAQPAAAADLSVMQWQLTAACNLLSAQQPAWDAVSSAAPDQSPAAAAGAGEGDDAASAATAGRLSQQRCLLAPATCPAARLFSGAACAQPGPLCWFYLDDEDCIRGPYDAATMLRWHCQGCLEDSLPVVALMHSPAAAQGGLVAPEPQAFLPLQQLLAAVGGGQQYRPLEPTWADAGYVRRTPGSLRPLRKTAAVAAAAAAGEQRSGQSTPSNTPRRRGAAGGWGDDVAGGAGTPPGRSKAWLVASRLHSAHQPQQQQPPSSPRAEADGASSKGSQEDVAAVGASSGSDNQGRAAEAPAAGETVAAAGVPAEGAAEGMSLGYSWLSAPQVALSHPLAAVQQVANMIMQAVQLDTPRTSPEPSPSPRGGTGGSPQRLPRSTHSTVLTSSPDSCERPHALLVDRSVSRSPDALRRPSGQARSSRSTATAATGQVGRPGRRRESSAEGRGMARGFAASAGHAGDVMTWAASSPDSPQRGGPGRGSSAARRGRQLQRGNTSRQRDGSSNSGTGWGPTSSLIQLAGLATPAAGGLGQLLSTGGLADTLHQALRALSPERSPTKSVVMSLS
jgi:hypothetical protein